MRVQFNIVVERSQLQNLVTMTAKIDRNAISGAIVKLVCIKIRLFLLFRVLANIVFCHGLQCEHVSEELQSWSKFQLQGR